MIRGGTAPTGNVPKSGVAAKRQDSIFQAKIQGNNKRSCIGEIKICKKSPADGEKRQPGMRFLRLIAEGLDPVGNFLLRDGGGKALARLPVAGAGERRELRAALADVAAAGGAEGDDRLAGEVIGLDERVHRPRGDTPPDRVADIDGVIVGPVRHGRGLECHVAQRRIVVLARDAAVGVVVVQVGARVRLGWLQLQQVAARRGGDGLGCSLRVAGRGEIDDERLAAAGGGGPWWSRVRWPCCRRRRGSGASAR